MEYITKQTQMNLPEELQRFLLPLEALEKIFSTSNDRVVIIGGVASSILGRPRLTVDVDAMTSISMNEIPALIRAAQKFGVEKRIDDAEEFAKIGRAHV